MKLQEHQVASVAEWSVCLQYDPWSMGLNPTWADFLLFVTSSFGQCSRYLTTYMHYMHDISVQIKLNKISLNFLFHSVAYNIPVSCYTVQNVVYIIAGQKIDKHSMLSWLKVFWQNETKIVKSKAPVCLRQLMQVVKSIDLQADFTGPVYSQFIHSYS